MGTLVIVVIAAALVVMFLMWWFSEDQRARRRMRSLPVRPVGEAIDGEVVRIVGPASVEAPLTSPLSGRPCACWRVLVEEKVRSGKSSHWRTVIDEHDSVDFEILDGSAKAVIDTAHVRPILDRDMHLSSGFMNDATPELEAFLAERGLSSQGWVFNKTMRYREGVLEPGEHVCVVGLARWEADPDRQPEAQGYRSATQPRRLVVSASPEEPLLISDEARMLT